MKTSELTGAALDWAVAKCADLPYPHVYDEQGGIVEVSPSTDWAQGGPIIEREWISLFINGDDRWVASTGIKAAVADTPLVAVMRCYVASKLGDDIELPEELT
jgi:hypothetical protein